MVCKTKETSLSVFLQNRKNSLTEIEKYHFKCFEARLLLSVCLVFPKYKLAYAYKRYAYKRKQHENMYE